MASNDRHHGKGSLIAPDLKIRLKRRADGSAAITCERADGTVTWQRQEGSVGIVFPSHDLTHFAVETALGYNHGFFGLVADGWDFADFATPWPRGVVPREALEVELIVGLLDMQRRMGAEWTADELLDQGRLYVEGSGSRVELPVLTDEMLERVKAKRGELFSRWAAVLPGATLELVFYRQVNDSARS